MWVRKLPLYFVTVVQTVLTAYIECACADSGYHTYSGWLYDFKINYLADQL